jgi:cyanoexosortase A
MNRISSRSNFLKDFDLKSFGSSLLRHVPPPTSRNLWLSISALVALQSLIVFTNTQITGNAITALIVWGGALICIEDLIDDLRPNPSKASLVLGGIVVLYTLYRTSQVNGSDSLLYLLVPIAGLGLILLASPFSNLWRYRDALLTLSLLPLFLIVQVLVATYVTNDLSVMTARFVILWLGLLGISPTRLEGNTVFVNGGAVQVMHECNGLEMIMQMFITAVIFLLAFPLRSRLGRFAIIILAPMIGFIVNSLRIALLAVFTSLNSDTGRSLFDFFHEQAGSLIFSGIAVFILGYLYLAILNRELPPILDEDV